MVVPSKQMWYFLRPTRSPKEPNLWVAQYRVTRGTLVRHRLPEGICSAVFRSAKALGPRYYCLNDFRKLLRVLQYWLRSIFHRLLNESSSSTMSSPICRRFHARASRPALGCTTEKWENNWKRWKQCTNSHGPRWVLQYSNRSTWMHGREANF